MGVTRFISGKLSFKGWIARSSVALSFLVMIIAVAVSSGFRKELRDAVTSTTGDVQLIPSNLDWLSGNTPISGNPAYLPHIDSIPGVVSVSPAVYRAGIVKKDDIVHGVLFKGIEDSGFPDSTALAVSIPSRLSDLLGIGPGDDFNAYFVGERVKVRKFRTVAVHEDVAEADDRLVVHARLSDIQRVNGWDSGQVSSFEVKLGHNYRSVAAMEDVSREIGAAALLYSSEDDEPVVSVSAAEYNPQLFDWLSLIDFNVYVILALMTVVAGFNMISGLLIMLFENIPTIGILKSLGMTDSAIAKIFLRSASSIVLKGMLAGNFAAILLCVLQDATHAVSLDPENYFISYVPVHLEIWKIIAADAASYLLIMLLLLLPSLFISRVDPAKTVRMG